MFRTEKSVRTLQAIAMIAGFAVLLWSLGLPSIRFADAANLTNVSDTLSDSSPAASSTHTVVFTSPTGISAGEYATVTMPTGFTNVSNITATDITFSTTSANNVVAACAGATDHIAFTTSGQNLVFEFCSAAGSFLSAAGTTTIVIGSDSGNQIGNPASPSLGNESYEVDIAAGASDSGSTRIVILNSITVTAAVDTIFTFAVDGLAAGVDMNGTTTTGVTSSTSIPFGELSAGVSTSSAQLLTVNTNAANGYSVTVQIDGPLESSTGADIDSFANGADNDNPASWTGPSNTQGTENTYGHWGVTSDDALAGRTNEFDTAEEFVGVSTTPKIVMGHTGPSNGTGQGVGTTTVGYMIQIASLQEAGDDYSAQLIYVATPTF